MPLFHKVSNLCLSSTLSVRSGSLGYINDARKFGLWLYIHIVILNNFIEFLSFWMYFFFLKCCETLHFFNDYFVWNYLPQSYTQDLKIRDDMNGIWKQFMYHFPEIAMYFKLVRSPDQSLETFKAHTVLRASIYILQTWSKNILNVIWGWRLRMHIYLDKDIFIN